MPTPAALQKIAAAAAHALTAADLAPSGAMRVRDSFHVERCSDGYQVNQITTWIDRNGEDDGDVCDLAYGLTEAEALEIVARLSGEAERVAA